MTSIDHVSINVKDIAKSRDFYAAALKPSGNAVILDIDAVAKFRPGLQGCSIGKDGKTIVWLSGADTAQTVHVAFSADSKEEVDAFYEAAMAAGGRDNGAPGPREAYGANYYAAFVIDPDGNNVEAVCRKSVF